MSDFAGKKVLLMAPAYFGYERVMEHSLADMGAEVTFVENRSFRYDPMNRGTRWYEAWFCKKQQYFDEIKPVISRTYDFCLFVNLFSFHPSFIENLRRQNPGVRCVLYLWDNLKYYTWERFLPLFDEVFTFDRVEARQYGLQYLPNFYVDAHTETSSDAAVDFYFVGSFQMHRFYWLDRAVRELEERGRTWFFYLYMPDQYNRFVYNKLVYWGTHLFPLRFRGYKKLYDLIFHRVQHPLVHDEQLPLGDIISKMIRARCVIDLPFPTQTGSTQRVIQALAFQKKVLTTNASASQESFFNPSFIRVIPIKDPDLTMSWGDEGALPPDMSHLRIDNWLRTLLKGES
jgi:hypothetical protein